jgi:pilus assembly protein CpaF
MVAKSASGMNQDGISTMVSARKYPSEEYFEFKAQIHDRLLDLIDLSLLDKLDRETLGLKIRQVVEKILREETFKLPLNLAEREKIFTEIIDEVLGLGPLEPLLKDPTISDILVNTYKSLQIYLFRTLWETGTDRCAV